MSIDTNVLVQAAVKAQRNAYAPYSGFPVGAALLAENETIYIGCNVENAASPEGMCAEAVAISAMAADGQRSIKAIAVVGGGAERPCMPCGGCRQKIQEFGSADTVVIVADGTGAIHKTCTLADLLPLPFGP